MVERGRVKCGQYWPLEEGRTEQHGYFIVRNTHIQVFQDFKLSHLELYNAQVSYVDDSFGCFTVLIKDNMIFMSLDSEISFVD